MVCLGLKPRAAGWKAQTNPLVHIFSYFMSEDTTVLNV